MAGAVIVETGIGSAAAGARRITGCSLASSPDGCSETNGVMYQVVVISAQTNPASSRAMAVTTMLRLVLRASRRRNLPHRRSCAVHALATTAGSSPTCRLAMVAPTLGRDL